MVVFIVHQWIKFMVRTDTEYQTANKPLKFVTATKSVVFTRTRFARLLAGRYNFTKGCAEWLKYKNYVL